MAKSPCNPFPNGIPSAIPRNQQDPGSPQSSYTRGELVILSRADFSPFSRYLPKRPWLARNCSGIPAFSLQLQTRRSPGIADNSLYPLIELGLMTMELSLSVPDEVLKHELAALASIPARILSLECSLVRQNGEVVARSDPGTGRTCSLTASLDGDDSRRVLDGLAGWDSCFMVECMVRIAAEMQLPGSSSERNSQACQRFPLKCSMDEILKDVPAIEAASDCIRYSAPDGGTGVVRPWRRRGERIDFQPTESLSA